MSLWKHTCVSVCHDTHLSCSAISAGDVQELQREAGEGFFVVTTGTVLANYLLWLMHGEFYYDPPLIGDRVYVYYLYVGYYLYKYKDRIRSARPAAMGVCLASLGAAFGITLGQQ